MEQDWNNSLNTEDEIDLRELIVVLWKHKIFILSITVIAALLTGLVSFFVLSPVYESKLNIVINMPETYQTKYGEYTLPITTNQQYLNLITSSDILLQTIEDMDYDKKGMTIEDLRNRISLGNIANSNTEQNSFEVTVRADHPDEARKLASSLYKNYLEFINVTTAEGAIQYYINYYTVQLSSLEDELLTAKVVLENNEALLAETPKTIHQREVIDEIIGQVDSNDFIILDEIINPNYTAIEADIIENRQTIYEIENSISVYKGYLEELAKGKEEIKQYYETGIYENSAGNIFMISETSVYLPAQPITPSRKAGPNNGLNIAIGTILGGMLGIFIILIRWWWQKGNHN